MMHYIDDKNISGQLIEKQQAQLKHSDSCPLKMEKIQYKQSLQINYIDINKSNLELHLNNLKKDNEFDFNISPENNNNMNDITSYTQSKKIVHKNPFTFNEDQLLLSIVNSCGDKKDWVLVSFFMKEFHYDRSARQCRDRYVHYLDPKLNTNFTWSLEEDNLLMNAVEMHGKKWKNLETLFPGKSEVSLRNRYHLLLRKKAKRNQKNEKRGNIMSNKFAFLEDIYKKNKKLPKRNYKENKKSLPIKVDQSKENLTNVFNDLNFISFDDDFSESFLIFE